MHLKRYRGDSVHTALGLARVELGPDALVLATRLVAATGWRGWMGAREVELTAAIDRASARSRETRPASDEADVVARLCATGLDRRLAQEVASALPARSRRGASLVSLREALAGRFATLASGDADYAPVEAFVGPPGVGKTTTIAKIAAQERACHGMRLGMIAADGYRVGAIEHLRLYADVIGLTLRRGPVGGRTGRRAQRFGRSGPGRHCRTRARRRSRAGSVRSAHVVPRCADAPGHRGRDEPPRRRACLRELWRRAPFARRPD